MKADSLQHVGIAVNSIEEALKLYVDFLGFEASEIKEVPDRNLKVAFIPAGDTEIELLEPTSDTGAIAKFIAKHGPGIHHIAFTVENIEAALAAAKEAGLQVIDETPRLGAHGVKVAFLHPKKFGGVLVEFCERK
ncbi:MAG: methylmalonyl-CoA epimerase [bacterium]|jgi:methylmalonyl-CoA/ethylmalonyl-CoA epimerase